MAPEFITKEFRSVHQFEVFSVNTPIQHALAEFMQDPNEYLQVRDFYENKRNLFNDLLKASRLKIVPAAGTYFQLADYSAISDKTDMDFADELCISHKVAAIPLSPFYRKGSNEKILRFCFAKQDDTLQKAAEILCKI